MLQWIRHKDSTQYTDSTSGIIYYPTSFPTTCRCHQGTAFNAGDFVNLINTTKEKVEYKVYERIINGTAYGSFDIMALGY